MSAVESSGIGLASPLAIVSIDGKNAPQVTGSLNVSAGRAMIGASGTITAGSATADVVLPRRGLLRVCATTRLQLSANSAIASGDIPGLMIALDHGAMEASYATGHNSDVVLTPDFRILMNGTGSADVKIRLGQSGDTCVDNATPPSQHMEVVVSSVFESGVYRIQPGQRVMFEHGSLREVIDDEKEPCGCPPPVKPESNEFPLAQSAGLTPHAPLTEGATAESAVAHHSPASDHSSEALVYNAIKTPPAVNPNTARPAQPLPAPSPHVKGGFFRRMGHFFGRIFGAEP